MLEFTTVETQGLFGGLRKVGNVQEDFTGRAYDNWLVCEYLEKSKYKCKCLLCGVYRDISSYFLKTGQAPKCVCQTGKSPKGRIDLTDRTFGEWRVLEYAGNKKWLCECSCGRCQIVDGYALRSGKSTKCKYSHNGISRIRGEPDSEDKTESIDK